MAYLTVAEFKGYKDITGTGDDALIGLLIDRAIAWLDTECRTTLVAEADTTRNFDAVDDVDGRDLILDAPLCAITSITLDGNSLASSEYTTVPRNDTPWHILRMKRNSTEEWSSYTTDAEDNVAIVGRWSWYQNAPGDIKHLAIRLVDYAYTIKDAGAFETVAIPEAGVVTVPQGFPVDAIRIVRAHRFAVVAI